MTIDGPRAFSSRALELSDSTLPSADAPPAAEKCHFQ
jgi:hypothetical protein